MTPNQIIHITAAITFIIFMPGFAMSFIFFKPDKIDWIERIVISLVLSLALIPLVTFYVNLLDIKISATSVVIEVLIILALTGIVLPFRYISFQRRGPVKFHYLKFTPQIYTPKTTERSTILNMHIITKELFQTSLITYIVLLLAETIKVGFVSFFFNLNILLVLVIVSGIIMVVTHYEKSEAVHFDWNWKNVLRLARHSKKQSLSEGLKKWDRYYILLMSVGGGLLVYYKTQDLGGLSVIISVITMTVIFLLSYLLFTEE